MALILLLGSIIGLLFSAAQFAWVAALSSLSLLIAVFSSVFSWNGLKVLTVGLSLWVVGATWSAAHSDVYGVVDEVWCKTEPIRIFFAEITDFLATASEGLICFWNLAVHWTAEIRNEALAIALECPEPSLNAVSEVLYMGGSLVNQSVTLVLNPLSYNIDLDNFWGHWTLAVNYAASYMQCFCYDISPLFDLIAELITMEPISCTIESAINVVIAAVRIPIKVVFSNFPALSFEFPVFDDLFDQLCSLLTCIGDIIDTYIRIVVARRLGTTYDYVDNPAIGCTIAKTLCVFLRVIELVVNFFVTVLKLVTTVIDLAQFIESGLDFDPLINTLVDLGDCVYLLFSNVNECAGQAGQNVILLVVRTIELLLATIRDPLDIDIALNAWQEKLKDVVGDTQYGDLGENYMLGFYHTNDDSHSRSWYCDMDGNNAIGSYLVTLGSGVYTGSEFSFPCAPGYTDPDTCKLPGTNYTSHCIQQHARKQTSLTCFVASALGNGICSRAVADFTTSVVRLFLVIPDFFTELTEGAIGPTPGPCGPFGTTTDRTESIDFIQSLFDLIISRVLSVLDYFGHVLGCIPVLSPVGKVVCQVVYAIFEVLTTLTRLLAIVVAFIVEGIIMIIELVSGFNLFPSCSGSQLLFWLQIFFENLLEEVFDIIAGFIDLILFDWFPGVINLNDWKYSEGKHPSFTECLVYFGDCVCVLVESIIMEIFSVGPFCAPSWKKRDVRPENNPFEMQDPEYIQNKTMAHPVFDFVNRLTSKKFDSSTDCGFIFNTYLPSEIGNLTDLQKKDYYDCVRLFARGYKLSHAAPGAPPDFFFNPHRVKNTTLNVIATAPHAFYYWITSSKAPIEEHMSHIDDPVTHSIWKSFFERVDRVSARLRHTQASQASPVNPVYSHFEMAAEAARLSFLLPIQIWQSLSKQNFTESMTELASVEGASMTTQLPPRSFDKRSWSIFSETSTTTASPGVTNSSDIFQTRVQHALNGLTAYGLVLSHGGDYALQSASQMVNISQLLNLLINGRANKSYTDVPPLIPGFVCKGGDGILRRIYNATVRCADLFTPLSLGSWGSLSPGYPIESASFFPSFSITRSSTFRASVTVGGKSDSLTTVGFDVAQFINERLLGKILGEIHDWPQKLIELFIRKSVDVDSTSKGVWYYLLFPFYCSKDKVDCSQGRGIVEGALWTLLYGTILLVMIGFVFPQGISSLIVTLLVFSVPAVFWGVSFGYTPICLPRIPECSASAVADLFLSLNVTCVTWPDGVANGPCVQGCPVEREIVDCRSAAGILDGFDELVFLMEWKFPTEMDYFRSSFIYGYVERIPWLNATLSQTRLYGNPPSEVMKFCFWTQILLIFQVVVIFSIASGAVGLTLLAVQAILGAFVTFIVAFFNVLSNLYLSIRFAEIDDEL